MSNKAFIVSGMTSGVAVLSACRVVDWTLPTLREAWSTVDRAGQHPDRLVEHLVVLLCGLALTVTLVWLAVSVVVCFVDVVRTCPQPRDASGVFRPALVRAFVAAALGAAVAGSGGPVAAAGRDAELPRALEGLTLPDRAYGGVRVHRVAAGESLWSVTEGLLPAGAGDGTVARTWPKLHRLNRDRVGADPHLVHPGTTLRLPARLPARLPDPTRGATP